MLLGDIGLGTLRGDTYHLSPALHYLLEFFHGADSREKEYGDFGPLAHAAGLRDEFHLGCSREPILDRGASQTIPMRHFDHRHPRHVQRLRDGTDLLDSKLVAHRV